MVWGVPRRPAPVRCGLSARSSSGALSIKHYSAAGEGVPAVRGTGRDSPTAPASTVESMDNQSETRDFLASGGRKSPGIGGSSRPRRQPPVPGLRRGEVGVLAGVSVEYYTRLERGNLSWVSEGVLEALARALQLDEAEQAHLFDLARAASTSRKPQRRRPATQPGYALHSEMYASPVRPANHARSSSWTTVPTGSTRTGSAPRMTRWRSCGPRPAVTPSTVA